MTDRTCRRNAIVFGILAAALCAPCFAAMTFMVRGKVTDAATGKPLDGAEMTFKDLEMGKVVKIKTKNGEYMQRLQWGNYKLIVKAEGYVPQELPRLDKPAPGEDDVVKDFKLTTGQGYLASELTKEEKERLLKEEEERKKQDQMKGQVKAIFDEAMKAKGEKDYDLAIQKFSEAVALFPTNAVLLGQLGDTYAAKGDQDNAIVFFKKAIEASPKEGKLYTNLGNAFVKKGMMDEAEVQFKKAIESDPLNAAMNYYNMGVVLFNAMKIDEAAAAFKGAIDSDAKYSSAYYQLAMCLVNKADYKGAVDAMETYLKTDPTGQYSGQVKQLLPDVKKMVN